MELTLPHHKETSKPAIAVSASKNKRPVQEQRYIPRWETSHRAYYRLPSKTRHIFRTQMRDLSLTGASLYISKDVPVNREVELHVYLSPHHQFNAKGTILWKATQRNHHCYAGVAFEHLPAKTQKMILQHAFPVPQNKIAR